MYKFRCREPAKLSARHILLLELDIFRCPAAVGRRRRRVRGGGGGPGGGGGGGAHLGAGAGVERAGRGGLGGVRRGVTPTMDMGQVPRRPGPNRPDRARDQKELGRPGRVTGGSRAVHGPGSRRHGGGASGWLAGSAAMNQGCFLRACACAWSCV